jgi:Protein of unknown function (DUF669)
MGNLQDIDLDKVEEMRDFAPIPAGDYVAAVIGDEIKRTKAGDGEYLQFCWEIVDGAHKGRRLWSRLNLWNKNETAVKIAKSEMKSIANATGIARPKDSAEFRDKLAVIKVVLEERDDKAGEFRNEIKGYSSASGGTITAPAPTQAAAPATAATPPWKRKA